MILCTDCDQVHSSTFKILLLVCFHTGKKITKTWTCTSDESKRDLGTYIQGLVSKIRKIITQLHRSPRNACFSECCLSPQEKKKHISVAGHVHKQLHLEKMISLWPMPWYESQSTSVAAMQVACRHSRSMPTKAGPAQNASKRKTSKQLYPTLLYKQVENLPETQEM